MFKRRKMPLRRLVVALMGVITSSNFACVIVWNWTSNRGMPRLPDRSSETEFLPEQLLRQYIEWHGELALRHQPHGRSFAIVYYSCPHRAGNVLHSLYNSMVWAMATNRTLLWRYDENGARNTAEHCDNFLERASWMPSYDEWSTALSLPAPKPILLNTYWNQDHAIRHNRTYRFFNSEEQRQSWMESVVTPPMFRDFVPSDDFETTRVHWNDDPLKLTVGSSSFTYWYYNRGAHLSSKREREMIRGLYSEGLSFLYGMLFRSTFQIKPRANSSLESHASLNGGVSIALHARHSHEEWDGSDVRDELRCLDQLLSSRQELTHGLDCIVYMMSDRHVTLDILRGWLQDRGCRAATAQHSIDTTHDAEFGWRPEMGVNGGPGFFTDLALVSRARTGFIGQLERSSTQLLLDLIEYDRKREARETNGIAAASQMPALNMCTYWRPR